MRHHRSASSRRSTSSPRPAPTRRTTPPKQGRRVDRPWSGAWAADADDLSWVSFDDGDESWQAWVPDPDHAPTILGVHDAMAVAFHSDVLPFEREALLLLDGAHRVTAVLLDPPATVGLGIGWLAGAGLDVEFEETIDLVKVPRVHAGPPDEHDVLGYRSLRRLHVLQGLRLLDVILFDRHSARSMAFAVDDGGDWIDRDAGPSAA